MMSGVATRRSVPHLDALLITGFLIQIALVPGAIGSRAVTILPLPAAAWVLRALLPPPALRRVVATGIAPGLLLSAR